MKRIGSCSGDVFCKRWGGLGWQAAALLMLCQVLMATAPARAGAPQIWFAPKQQNIDMTQPPAQRIQFTYHDFAAMLPPNAPWQSAASHVAVLNIGQHTIQHFGDLTSVVAMANSHSWLVATSGAVVYTDGLCQPTPIEGVSPSVGYAREIVGSIRKWKKAGGRLDVVSLDSPFYFGYYAIAGSCHYSIAEVARRSATTLREILAIYPNLRIMDAEGPGPITVNAWLPDFAEYLADVKASLGRPIDSVGLDMHWDDPWHTGYVWTTGTATATSFLHAHGVQVGLFINADNKVASNQQWMDLNRQRLSQAAGANLGLDFICICSWAKLYPQFNLPEASPDAYVSLIDSALSAFGGGS